VPKVEKYYTKQKGILNQTQDFTLLKLVCLTEILDWQKTPVAVFAFAVCT